jgi:short-subunit dehydrogenase
VSASESARVEYAKSGVSFTCVMPSFTATDLVAGTKGVRFIATITPEAVAKAIVKSIKSRKKDVFVPGSVGVVIRTQPLVGRALRDAINHMIRADRTFLEVDRGARSYYEERIAKPVAADADAPVKH